MILGGPALFVAGHALFKLAVLGHVSWSRLVALVPLLVLAAMAPPMVHLQPLVVAIAATMVLVAIAVSDTMLALFYSRQRTT